MHTLTEEQFLAVTLRTLVDEDVPEPVLLRLAGDVSSRRYYRARFDRPVRLSARPKRQSSGPLGDGSKEAAGLDHPVTDTAVTSTVVTVYPEAFDDALSALETLSNALKVNPDVALTYANAPLAQLEQTQFLKEHGLPVPGVLFVQGKLEPSPGAPAVGVVVFEDFGDERLLERLEGVPASARQQWYTQAIELIAHMHNTTQNVLTRPMVGSTLAFTEEKLMWELHYFIKHYFNSYLNQPLSSTTLAALEQELGPLCRALAACPRVLCHRDYHARNLMVQNDSLYLIDYQDARLGPTTYDLVSLLLDPYAPTAGLDIPALLDRYRAVRATSLPAVPSEEDFALEWSRMAAQRLLKAAGTYAFMVGVRGASAFEGYLKPTVAQARTYLSQLGGFDRLCALLQ